MTEKKDKKICLITPGHLATNPRLVKEIDALTQAGYTIHVVFTQYMDYLLKDDDLILAKYPNLTFDKLNWTKVARTLRASTGIVQKLSKWFSRLFGGNTTFHKIILNRNYLWQLKKAIHAKAHLYIAHNSGALPIAADAAEKNKTLFGFDAEDFHRGENLSFTERRSLIFLEDLYLPKANHLTAASPLIAKAYENLYHRKLISILNVFPQPHIQAQPNQGVRPLQLFWFSQTVGMGRGIENIITAISLLKDRSPILHLLGDTDPSMKNEIKLLAATKGLIENNIIFYNPVSPDEIFNLAANFDIGMATETGNPINRDICLTNKIFTYIQAGLAVVASNTSAQTDLINRFPTIGSLYDNENIATLTAILANFQLYPEQLDQAKQNCLSLSETEFNWDKEKRIFLNALTESLI